MENYNRDNQGQENRDAQNAEEFINANPNANTNPNENPNPAPEYSDQENKRLDTDPNRYAHFAGGDGSTDDESGDSGYGTDDGEETHHAADDRSHYSSEDDRQINAKEAYSHRPENDTRSSDAPENDQTLFFDGL